MLHYLRIAVTALSLTTCVLLIGLWVRSYWQSDVVAGSLSKTKSLRFQSLAGQVHFYWYQVDQFSNWWRGSEPTEDIVRMTEELLQRLARSDDSLPPQRSFVFNRYKYGGNIRLPHWSLVLLTSIVAVIAGAPWIKWRFSLRTLLIATTLVAIGLGAVIYVAR